MKITHFINSNNVIVAQTTDKILKKKNKQTSGTASGFGPGY